MTPIKTHEEFLFAQSVGDDIAKRIEQELVNAKDVDTMKAFNDAIRLAARIARGKA